MHILVCGGAGYIGSHASYHLANLGHEISVLDNFSSGHRQAVRGDRLIEADLRRPETLEAAFRRPVDAVMHFCALSIVSESVNEPYEYYDNNVVGTLNLLRAMHRHGVDRLVFSSTAAVFGQPLQEKIDENHPKAPINPYGTSKRMVEQILADAASAYGLRSVSLRYFNAAGAQADAGLGESHQPEMHLIPNILRTAKNGDATLKVFGDDYDTFDGTCIRDYVHVLDLAQAHALALRWLMQDLPGAHYFNLGNGSGFSVLQIIDAARAITGRQVAYQVAPRRPGDPAVLVASSALAHEKLGWIPRHTQIEDILASAWSWHQSPAF